MKELIVDAKDESNPIKSEFLIIGTGLDKRPEILKFNDGAIQVRLKKDYTFLSSTRITVIAKIKCSDGLIALAQIKHILDTNFKGQSVSLELGYVPYARYDRAMLELDSFSLKVFSKFLNSMAFDNVLIQDPHSDMSTALIENVEVVHQADLAKRTLGKGNFYNALVSPDSGAQKKISVVAKALNYGIVIEASKVRDVETGKITRTVVHADAGSLKGQRLLIVDDICEGGRTFVELARALKDKGADHVDLYVTHGILPNASVDTVLQDVDNIYCYNLWCGSNQDIQYYKNHPNIVATKYF